MELEELKIMEIVLADKITASDAIICLEGDGQERTKTALKIFNKKIAPIIVVSGGYDSPPFSIVAPQMADYLIKDGVSREKIIIESISQNTREQAQEVMKIVKEMGWKKIILVASQFHQARAYLTFLKAMEDLKIKIVIINASVKGLSWSQKVLKGKTRKDLLKEEFKKIKEYSKNGHIFSFNKVLEYQKWKELQH